MPCPSQRRLVQPRRVCVNCEKVLLKDQHPSQQGYLLLQGRCIRPYFMPTSGKFDVGLKACECLCCDSQFTCRCGILVKMQHMLTFLWPQSIERQRTLCECIASAFSWISLGQLAKVLCTRDKLVLRLNHLGRSRHLKAALCFDLEALARYYRKGTCCNGTIADDAMKILRLFVIFRMERESLS